MYVAMSRLCEPGVRSKWGWASLSIQSIVVESVRESIRRNAKQSLLIEVLHTEAGARSAKLKCLQALQNVVASRVSCALRITYFSGFNSFCVVVVFVHENCGGLGFHQPVCPVKCTFFLSSFSWPRYFDNAFNLSVVMKLERWPHKLLVVPIVSSLCIVNTKTVSSAAWK